MKIERNSYIDVAKGIGILAVIAGHISVGTLDVLLYSFHLPLFFCVSGYFFRCQDNFKTFFIRKSKEYLIPYIFCSIVIAIFELMRDEFNIGTFVNSLLLFGVQKRYTTLWFLTSLYLTVILFWCICKVCRNNNIKILKCSIILSVIFICFDEYVNISLPWNLDTAFIALIFIAFGYILRQNNLLDKMINSNRKPMYIILFCGINIGGTIINYWGCNETYEMYYGSYGIFPLTISAACSGTLAIILLSTYVRKKSVLEWIGKNSMSFFAFHQSIGMAIMMFVFYKIGFMKGSSNIQTIIVSKIILGAGTLVICYIIHFVIMKFKLGFLLGKKKS